MVADEADQQTSAELELLELTQGAVAVIDVLGFRGIWKRHPSVSEILNALSAAESNTHADLELVSGFLMSNVRLQAAFFSDTIVLTATQHLADGGRDATLGEMVSAAALGVQSIISQAVQREPKLAYRGCIASGKLAVRKQYFVGPAIDEASEWYEKANAAVVWLLPSAANARGLDMTTADHRLRLFHWDVPIKGSGYLRTLVANPLAMAGRPGDPVTGSDLGVDDFRKLMLSSFDREHVDVEIKYQETERLLQAAV